MAHAEVTFARLHVSEVETSLLVECAELFNSNYGFWGEAHPRAGARIQQPANKIVDRYLSGKKAWISTARAKETLVGYATALQIETSKGTATWVTQLVVHEDYRNQLVASLLLDSIWGYSQHYAWGIASANPFAVRALEKATRRLCMPEEIERRISTVKRMLSAVPYLADAPIEVSKMGSIIDTSFDQDISRVDEMKSKASQVTPWAMGPMKAGHEWLAVTFNKQRKRDWSKEEFEAFMQESANIVAKAYDRMAVAEPQKHHGWASLEHAENEVRFILDRVPIARGARVVDFGCGAGRHTIALAKAGIEATGIDQSRTAIANALQTAEKYLVSARFIQYDCAKYESELPFDAAICLYDVIGSYPDEDSNLAILINIVRNIKPGSAVFISVMSYEYIESVATQVSNGSDLQSLIDRLQPSDTMQASGNIFNPDFIVLDRKERVVYRREIFDLGGELPTEMIVRDRRYTRDEISLMCDRVGLEVISCGFIKAGRFDLLDQENDKPTKEVLIYAKKRLV